MVVTRFLTIWAARIMPSVILPWRPTQPAPEIQPSVMTPWIPATPVVRTSPWETRQEILSPLAVTTHVSVPSQASVSSTGLTLSQSAVLLPAFLLTTVLPPSSAASTSRLGTQEAPWQYLLIQITTWEPAFRPAASNTTLNRWTRPAEPFFLSSR